VGHHHHQQQQQHLPKSREVLYREEQLAPALPLLLLGLVAVVAVE
jgi:hypothetical protein